MKGLVEFSTFMFFMIIFIIGLLVSVVGSFIIHTEVVANYKSADEELTSIGLMNKLITSKDCFSTGNAGILDIDIIKEKYKNHIDSLCFGDNFPYKYTVNISSGEDFWIFGNTLPPEKSIKRKYYISIKDGNKIVPGKIKIYLWGKK